MALYLDLGKSSTGRRSEISLQIIMYEHARIFDEISPYWHGRPTTTMRLQSRVKVGRISLLLGERTLVDFSAHVCCMPSLFNGIIDHKNSVVFENGIGKRV